jgi:hypothetical protein
MASVKSAHEDCSALNCPRLSYKRVIFSNFKRLNLKFQFYAHVTKKHLDYCYDTSKVDTVKRLLITFIGFSSSMSV